VGVGVGFGSFGKVGVGLGVGNFTSDSATLFLTSGTESSFV